jgi:hypothetical protein
MMAIVHAILFAMYLYLGLTEKHSERAINFFCATIWGLCLVLDF